ncbi:hypothetical protein JTB14_024559 [Gonioctena quinquepunctata]|nr:hypothetical protein JTB14_024559 [Gonioctena quinquepunctata]
MNTETTKTLPLPKSSAIEMILSQLREKASLHGCKDLPSIKNYEQSIQPQFHRMTKSQFQQSNTDHSDNLTEKKGKNGPPPDSNHNRNTVLETEQATGCGDQNQPQ